MSVGRLQLIPAFGWETLLGLLCGGQLLVVESVLVAVLVLGLYKNQI